MTNSEIFKKAHKIARQVKSVVGNYMVAFKYALTTVYSSINSASMTDKLKNLGLSVWGADFGKARIYIDDNAIKTVFGLAVTFYKTGNISSATLNDEKISNSKAYKLLSDKIYFDIASEKFVGTTMAVII